MAHHDNCASWQLGPMVCTCDTSALSELVSQVPGFVSDLAAAKTEYHQALEDADVATRRAGDARIKYEMLLARVQDAVDYYIPDRES